MSNVTLTGEFCKLAIQGHVAHTGREVRETEFDELKDCPFSFCRVRHDLVIKAQTQSAGAMTMADYLLSHLASECCEVAVRCVKAQHFGLTEIEPGQEDDNRHRIVYELCDVYAIVHLLQRHGALPKLELDEFNGRVAKKNAKAQHFRDYSRELGRLE